jgi:hypothetical protein
MYGDHQVFQLRYNKMDNLVAKLAALLQPAVSDKSPRRSGNFVKALPHALLDNQIRLAGFVFERDEYDASRGAGALAQEN